MRGRTQGDAQIPAGDRRQGDAGARRPVDARSSARSAAGVKIAFGTDSGVSPHGRNAEEFALLVEHGLSAAAALRDRRRPPPRCSASIGSPARSRPARKPTSSPSRATCWRNIAATEHVRFVMKGGKIYKNDGKQDSGRGKESATDGVWRLGPCHDSFVTTEMAGACS